MILNSIDILNFRGFREEHFDLNPQMNVIVGNNTAGKTTILHAIQIALGAYLQALTIIPKDRSYRRNFVATDRQMLYNESKDDFFPVEGNPIVAVNAEITTRTRYNEEKKNVRWYREAKGNTTIHARKNVGELIDVVDEWMKYRTSENDNTNVVLPLVLAFGADRIDNNYKLFEKTKERVSKIAKAYKFALHEYVDFRSALNWIYKYNSTAKYTREFARTDLAFYHALGTAARLKNIEVRDRELWATVKVTGNPKETHLTYEMMSSGFKAMVNIVSEIAYRCIMLNGWLGEDAVKETHGVVMIDEVDLYLHPHWQRHVLADLHEAFPKIQFIVTTHSPFVVQSVDSQNVITLDGDKSVIPPFNRGIEEVASTEMGISDENLRSEKYRRKENLAKQYFELVDRGENNPDEIEVVRLQLEQLELDEDLMNDPALKALLQFKRGKI